MNLGGSNDNYWSILILLPPLRLQYIGIKFVFLAIGRGIKFVFLAIGRYNQSFGGFYASA